MGCGLGRVEGAEEGKHSQAGHQGSCSACLLAADAPGHSSQAGLQHKAAAWPLSCHCCVTTHPSSWLSLSGCRDRADRPGSAVPGWQCWAFCLQSCNPRASPLGDEQITGGVWIVLTLLDSSFLQLGFPLDFHLGAISNVCLMGSDSKLGDGQSKLK